MTLKPPVSPNPIITDYRAVYDETTALPRRSGLRFIGNQVTVTDDEATDRTNVTVSDATVTVTLPLQSVDELSANPRSVTDWGTLLNTAIAAGTRRFLFGPHTYNFSTQLDMRDTKGVIFEGVVGLTHPTTLSSGTTGFAKLIWTGAAGTGPAMLFGGASVGTHGFCMRDIAFLYSSALFNGTLLRTGPSTDVQCGTAVIERCIIGSSDDAASVKAAAVLLDLRTAVGWKIRDTTLQGAVVGIKGYDTDTSSNPDDLLVEGCNMMSFTTAAFLNVGSNWTIQDNVFEFGGFGGVYMPSVTTSNHSAAWIGHTSDLNYHRNRHWDFVDDLHIVVSQTANETWQFSADDNWFYTCSGIHMKFAGQGTVRIRNLEVGRVLNDATYPKAIIDLGTQTKNMVDIRSCWWFASGPATPITNLASHYNVQIETSHYGVREIRGYERLGYENLTATSFAVAAGQPNVDPFGLEHWGNDTAGAITVGTTGAGPSTAGRLIDVTFGTPMVPTSVFGNSPDAAHKVPTVILTPYEPSVGYTNVSDTFACQAYAVAVASTATGFRIYTVNAIPAGKRVGWAYRVVLM